MTESETFTEQWPGLSAKVRDRWPKLTDEDIGWIAGDLDHLVQKVKDRYGWTRSEVVAELTALLQPAERDHEEIPAGQPKLGDHGLGSRRPAR